MYYKRSSEYTVIRRPAVLLGRVYRYPRGEAGRSPRRIIVYIFSGEGVLYWQIARFVIE